LLLPPFLPLCPLTLREQSLSSAELYPSLSSRSGVRSTATSDTENNRPNGTGL
jgi:hypothetical protein